MATPANALEQVKNLYGNLSLRQKFVGVAVLALTVAGFLSLFLLANRVTFKPIYTDLAPEAAADVVGWLKAQGTKYRITQGGSTVEVPEDQVYDMRLAMASAGIPKGGTVGFELFDKTNLGATDFVQQVNYQRALQGELERTIERFPQVESARVHIAQPKDSLFVSDRKDVTASVALTLKNGQDLQKNQVKGIAHLVASAVPRLKEANVSIVDGRGDILYEDNGKDTAFEDLTSAQLAYQKRLENYYRQKIQSMLENALGPNKAIARVSAEIDFDHVQIDEDRFDPDTVAVRSEQKLLETNAEQNPGGVPGVKGGLADKLQGNTNQQETGGLKKRQQDTINYEITRMRRQVNGSIGKLARLSVAVLVDGSYKVENGNSVYVPRSAEEVANLEQIVKAAMGYSESRGDDLSVVNVAFTAPPPATTSTMTKMVDAGSKLIKPLSNLLLAMLFIFLVLRPLLKRYVFKPEEAAPPPREGAKALEEAELPKLKTFPAIEPGPNVQEELQAVAHNYPERAAALIKIWLRERPGAEKG